MKEVGAIVVGAAGKMGARIIHLIKETPSLKLFRAIERSDHPSVGKDIGEVIGLGKMGVILESSLKKGEGDVIINFSSPQASLESLELAKGAGLAIVIGTTGLSPEQTSKVKELSKSVRCVLAPNMSVGVNVMFRIVQEVARALGPEYDIEILEAHHRLQKDSPSGTAIKLGELISSSIGRDFGKVEIYGRRGMVGAEPMERRTTAGLIIAACSAGWHKPILVTAAGLIDAETLNEVGSASGELYALSEAHVPAVLQGDGGIFDTRYRSIADAPALSPYARYAYAATRLMATLIEEGAVTRAKLSIAIAAANGRPTSVGPVAFDHTGQQGTVAIAVFKAHHGHWLSQGLA